MRLLCCQLTYSEISSTLNLIFCVLCMNPISLFHAWLFVFLFYASVIQIFSIFILHIPLITDTCPYITQIAGVHSSFSKLFSHYSVFFRHFAHLQVFPVFPYNLLCFPCQNICIYRFPVFYILGFSANIVIIPEFDLYFPFGFGFCSSEYCLWIVDYTFFMQALVHFHAWFRPVTHDRRSFFRLPYTIIIYYYIDIFHIMLHFKNLIHAPAFPPSIIFWRLSSSWLTVSISYDTI